MKLTKAQIEERDQVIFGEPIDWEKQPGGMKEFDDLSAAWAEELMENGHINWEDAYNCSPEAGELIDWALDTTDPVGGLEIVFEGYVAGPNREDYAEGSNIVLTAIVANWRNMEGLREKIDIICAFANAWSGADEFDMDENRGRAWWD